MTSFIKNIGLMSASSVFTQLLGFIVIPLITRYYLPEYIGEAALYGSILMPFAVFANMGFGSAIISAESNEDSMNLFVLNIMTTIIVSIISIGILIVLKNLEFVNLFIVNKYIFLLPISVLLHGVYISSRALNIRQQRFGFVSIAQSGKYLVENGAKVAFAFSGNASAFVLVVSEVVGGFTSISVLNLNLWKKIIRFLLEDVSIYSVKAVFYKYVKFPKFILVEDFVSRISEQLPIYILALYFNSIIVGFYAIGLRLLTMPVSLFGRAIGDVFFQKVAENKEVVPEMLYKVLNFLSLSSISVFIFLGLYSDQIFLLILGDKWTEAGVYTQLLAFFMFCRFTTLPTSYLMIVLGRQELSFLLNIITLLTGSVSLLLGGLLGNEYMAILLYSLGCGTVNLIFGAIVFNLAGLELVKMSRLIILNIKKNIPIIIVLVSIKLGLNRDEMIVVLGAGSITVVNLLILVSREKNFVSYIFDRKT
jgi:lipopolysaccharide exporter